MRKKRTFLLPFLFSIFTVVVTGSFAHAEGEDGVLSPGGNPAGGGIGSSGGNQNNPSTMLIFGQSRTLSTSSLLTNQIWNDCYQTGKCSSPAAQVAIVPPVYPYPIQRANGELVAGCYELRGKQLVRVANLNAGGVPTCPASPNSTVRLRVVTYARQVCPNNAVNCLTGGKLLMGCTIDNLSPLGGDNPFSFTSVSCFNGAPVIRDSMNALGGGNTVVYCTAGEPGCNVCPDGSTTLPCPVTPPPCTPGDPGCPLVSATTIQCGTRIALGNLGLSTTPAGADGTPGEASLFLQSLVASTDPTVTTVYASSLNWSISPTNSNISIIQGGGGFQPRFIGLTPGVSYTASALYDASGQACPLSRTFSITQAQCAAGYSLSGGVCTPCPSGTYNATPGGTCTSCGALPAVANSSSVSWFTVPSTGATSSASCNLAVACNSGFVYNPGPPAACDTAGSATWDLSLPAGAPAPSFNAPPFGVLMMGKNEMEQLKVWDWIMHPFSIKSAMADIVGGPTPPVPGIIWNYRTPLIRVLVSPGSGTAFPSGVTSFQILPTTAFYNSGKDGLVTDFTSVFSELAPASQFGTGYAVGGGALPGGGGNEPSPVDLTLTGTPLTGGGAQVLVPNGSGGFKYNYVGGIATVTPVGGAFEFALFNTRSGTYNITVKDNLNQTKIIQVVVGKSVHSCDHLINNAPCGGADLVLFGPKRGSAEFDFGLDSDGYHGLIVGAPGYSHCLGPQTPDLPSEYTGSNTRFIKEKFRPTKCFMPSSNTSYPGFPYCHYADENYFAPGDSNNCLSSIAPSFADRAKIDQRDRCILSSGGKDLIVHRRCRIKRFCNLGPSACAAFQAADFPGAGLKACTYGANTYYIPTASACPANPSTNGTFPSLPTVR